MKEFYTTRELEQKYDLTAPFLREVINMGYIETSKLGSYHLIEPSKFKSGIEALIKDLSLILENE